MRGAEMIVKCGNCRLFSPNGKRNEYGEIVGFCDEFPIAGEITEHCRCGGPLIPFKPKQAADRNGNVRSNLA